MQLPRSPMGLHLIELTTVHPVLVHVTVGAAPLFVLAYLVAWLRHSRRWTFAGDFVLVGAAVFTLGTFAFGLVSNAVLPWPGGLETWRGLHLAFGAASCALLVVIAVARLRARGRIAGPATVGWSLAVAACIGWTGWIGGEVLTYHSGMSVAGAADGALAPELNGSTPRPHDLPAAMADARFAWASAGTRLAATVVDQPAPSDFEAIARYAHNMQTVAEWLKSSAKGKDAQETATLRSRGTSLAARAIDLEGAARAQDLRAVSASLGAVTEQCIGCHEATRWKPQQAAAAR